MLKPLEHGDFVEIAFQTQSGPVRGMAEMLVPMRSAMEGALQPFRFVALGDDDHRKYQVVDHSTRLPKSYRIGKRIAHCHRFHSCEFYTNWRLF